MNVCWKIFLALLIFSSCSNDSKSNNAVVVTRHHLATDIGAEILKNGGNAIDSAVAAIPTNDESKEYVSFSSVLKK